MLFIKTISAVNLIKSDSSINTRHSVTFISMKL